MAKKPEKPREHVVVQGETLPGIAARYGFSDWKKIYNDPANSGFRQQRQNPNILYPGDRIVIPKKESRIESGATETGHRYVARRSRTRLRLVVRDADGNPISGCPYQLETDGEALEGTTGGDGFIEQDVSPIAPGGDLTLWLDADKKGTCIRWTLRFGHLDPVEYLTGVQARLTNLGFYYGRVDGENGPLTRRAVRAFQERHGLKVDGIPGPITQGKIEDVHGC